MGDDVFRFLIGYLCFEKDCDFMDRMMIKDIVRFVGVFFGVVFFVFNDKLGVFDFMRVWVKVVVKDLGWCFNVVVRVLLVNWVGVVGFVIVCDDCSFVGEGFFFYFIVGMEEIFIFVCIVLVL